MKHKILIIFILLVLLVLLLTGCRKTTDTEEDNEAPSLFTQVEATDSYKVLYHKETKVMYAVSCGGYNQGNFTLLVDPDGKPLLWEGRK